MAEPIFAVLQAVPGLLSLAERIAGTAEAAQRNAQLLEFQKALIGLNSMVASVQQENATLRQEKSAADEKLSRMEDWESQKQRYKLMAPFPGCMVYALQKPMSAGEPAHYLCAACFQKAKRSILQSKENRDKKAGMPYSSFLCPECGSEGFTKFYNAVTPQYAEDITPEII